MAEIPYDAAQGEDLFDGSEDFNSMDSAYDSTADNPYLFNARDRAQFRDFSEYVRQSSVIGNAKQIQGIPVDDTAPLDGQGLFYNTVTGEYEPSTPAGDAVHNATGSAIASLVPVYLTGSITSSVPNCDLSEADAMPNYSARDVQGVTTATIANGADGEVVSHGVISDVDTSAWSVGDEVWLSETAGQLTNTEPLLPSSQIRIGLVLVSSATVGAVDVNIKDLSWAGGVQSSNQSTERSGFVLNTSGEAVDSAGGAVTISVVDGTRTLTIAGTSGSFPIFSQDNLFLKIGDQSVVFPDTEGNHYFYFDDVGDIQTTTTFDMRFIIGPYVFAAYLYWDATNNETILDGPLCEYHGIQMDGATHLHFHRTLGATTDSGMTLGNIISNGNGSLDTHAQFSIANGSMSDEDLSFTITGKASTAGTRILGLEGATPVLRQYDNSGFSVLTDNDVTTKGGTSTGRLIYNYFDGADWVYDAVSNNDYVLCHTFALGTCGGGEQLYSIPGQAEYGNANSAREGAIVEINSIVQALPFAEVRPISSVILQTGNGYGNSVKARIRPDSDGNDYVDHRASGATGSSGLATAEHNTLAGLDNAATASVTYGHLTNDQYNQITAPNLLINADGTDPLNQRGVVNGGSITSADFGPDRFQAYDGGSTVVWRLTADTAVGVTINTAVGAVQWGQPVEKYKHLKGKKVTYSARVRSNLACYLRIYDGISDTASDPHTGGGGWETLSMTVEVNGSANQLQALAMMNAGIATGKYMEFEWIKLEVGSVATPFVADLPSRNTGDCERYHLEMTVEAINGTKRIAFPTTMRLAPDVTVSVGSAGNITKHGFELTHTAAVSCDVSADKEL